jgi:hypothetical protein
VGKEAGENAAGISGNPMLQIGGEQDAVTEPAPGSGVETVQDSWQPVPTETEAGCDADQVRGILLRTLPFPTFCREVFPSTSVTVATRVSEVPLETEKFVCNDPAWPSSNVMFWMGQVSKKSNTSPTGGGGTRVGCRKELLETPLAEA